MSAISQFPSSLFSGPKLTTGDKNDPLLPKLIKAINHANEIEITVSFIQPSGINLLFDALVEALKRNVSLKILVSDYLYITSPIALQRLMSLQDRGAQTKLFQCQQGKSFHMKSYIFIKTNNNEIIEGCAFVGSNNISRTALTKAHEWCLRHDFERPNNSAAALEFKNIRQQFTLIFNHQHSTLLSHELIKVYSDKHQQMSDKRALVGIDGSSYSGFQFEGFEPATPNTVQELALDALAKNRLSGFKRGLVILATGMGKTWLSAFDAKQMNAKKVLFVAHREEILLQAQQTFIRLFKQANTGLYNSDSKNFCCDFLFASIQTLGQQKHLTKFNKTHFDYIVVDEFHHASAPTYKNLLNYFQPAFMLGLTATPERTDQADILSLCDNNIVFERNLVHGIDSKILVPFDYHGIYDEFVNYEEIPWRNGHFDPASLDTALATKQRSAHIFKHWQEKKQSRTLAFCVSTKHADYMAQSFSQKGINACAVYNGSNTRRNEALAMLSQGKVDIVFSVDLFNEGTDIPAIDTILMLRPTSSKVLFLQQLGRGLRQSTTTSKTHLTVIDFIGNHSTFLHKPASLLGVNTPKEIANRVTGEKNSPALKLPDGCFVNYAPEIIAFWQQLGRNFRYTTIEEYQLLSTQLERRPSATEFYQQGYDLSKMRKQTGSWLALVAEQECSSSLTDLHKNYGDFLLHGIEKTSMSKSFKGILLEAFLNVDGFNQPPSTQALAEESWSILARRPDLKSTELPDKIKPLTATSKAWHSYWLGNPIKHSSNAKKDQKPWFIVEEGKFKANFTVPPKDIAALHLIMQELVDLRLAQYISRPAKKVKLADKVNVVTKLPMNTPTSVEQGTELPYYTDLKIACGHFKTSRHDECENYLVPESYGNLDASKHFIAMAQGNSMNGGKHPIIDGDLLLLEWITATSAGSISNKTLAIEMIDETGDSQYLLRVVKKQKNGSYLLTANNPDYNDKLATEQMHTFARFKAVIPSN